MSDLSEITKAIMASNDAFEEFKKSIDSRFAGLESAEAKARRPHLGQDSRRGARTEEDAAELKSFRAFMSSGKIEEKAMSIGSGPDGGFTVPKVIDSMIESLVVNVSPIRSVAQVQQISTSDYHKLINLHGTASGWAGETQARPATNTPQFADIAPPMGDLYANPQCTQTMLDDAFFDAESWLADEIATEFARAEGVAFINGTGVNQPKGLLSGPAPVTTADGLRAFGTMQYFPSGVSGAWPAPSSINEASNALLNLVFAVKAPYRANAKWLMTKKTLATVTQFQDYSGRYILTPNAAPGIPNMIFGYPVVECEDMPEIGAGSLSIAFGDFKRGYLIVDRIGTRVVRDPFTNKPSIGFYTVKKVGGTLQNTEAIKFLKFSVS
jgi:HK97 family phage major capsid protein